MPSVRTVLQRTLPKIQKIEENPTVTILKLSQQKTTNPFEATTNEVYDLTITVPCVFSEQPEIVSSSNNITTQQVSYFYILSTDLAEFDLADRLIFNESRYRPLECQQPFGMWKIRAIKE